MQTQVLISVSPEELTTLIADALSQAITNTQISQLETGTNNELISIKEASQLLHVSIVTIHTWKRKGILPFHRLSRKIYFKKDEILEALNTHTKLKKFFLEEEK
jgi:excisionase family DNA binding protein